MTSQDGLFYSQCRAKLKKKRVKKHMWGFALSCGVRLGSGAQQEAASLKEKLLENRLAPPLLEKAGGWRLQGSLPHYMWPLLHARLSVLLVSSRVSGDGDGR